MGAEPPGRRAFRAWEPDTLSRLSFLRSPHRACVAGFTNITFSPESGLIDGNGSYVSFSRYSEAVSLPQDPGRGRTSVLLAVLWVRLPVSTEGSPMGSRRVGVPGFSSQKLRCRLAMRSPAPFSECQLHFSLQLCVCPHARHTG